MLIGSIPVRITKNIKMKELIQDRLNRIEQRKNEILSKTHRKLKRYSDGFNEMFSFFLKSYRSGILNFCGSIVNVDGNCNSSDAKFCFRKIENGEYKPGEIPKTRHPNILKGVIMGKKSFGLWVDQWSDGICENSFSEQEILSEFEKLGITIPEPLLIDFRNRIDKKKRIRNRGYLEKLNRDHP